MTLRRLLPLAAPLAALVATLATPPAASLQAQQPAAPVASPAATLPTDPDLTIGHLPNGLTYYIRANHRPEKRMELRLVVNAGSILEDENQRGLAHFVEHMAFNGTKNFEKGELVSFIERAGMRFGADLNASTSFDETIYMLQLPTDSTRLVQQGFQVLEDWAHNISFEHAEIDKERGVVIEEWRLGQGAGSRLRDKQFPIIFANSQYANRLPIGVKANLETFRDSTLTRFYRTWYRPDLMAVVAVGDFDKAVIEAQIRQHFAALVNPPAERPRTLFPVPDHDSTLVTIATDKEATGTSVAVRYLQPVRDHTTDASYRQSLVEDLFQSMFNERLAELTQKADPPFINGGVGQGRLARTKESFVLVANVKDGGSERGLGALLTEAERVDKFGFTQPELEREKANLLRGTEQRYAERERTSSGVLAGEYVSDFLNTEPSSAVGQLLDLERRALPTIALSEVNALARDWITDRNRVVVVSAPEKAGLTPPTEAQLLATFATARSAPITAFVETVSSAPLLATTLKPAAVTASRAIGALGVREATLANGVRIVMKPTDFKADEVLMNAFSLGGTSLASDADVVNASGASIGVSLGGLGEFSAVDLGKKLAGRAVRVGPYIGSITEGVQGSASPRDLETMFQLTHLYFTAPRRDTVAFASYVARIKAATANRAASPEAAFSDTLTVTLAQHNPRVKLQTSALYDQWNLDRMLAFYRGRFADASDFTFVFVGNFSPDSLLPLAQKYLGTLPSLHRKEMPRDAGVRFPAGVVTRTVRRGTEPKSQTAMVFTGPAKYTDSEREALRGLTDVLTIRLRESLREQLGGTYGVNVGGGISKYPRAEYQVGISFGSSPDHVDTLFKATFAEIAKLKQSGPTADDLAKVKETQRRELETASRQNGYWLSQLSTRYQYGEDPLSILKAGALIDALDAAAVQRAARSFLDEKNYVRVSLFPENYVSAPAAVTKP